MFVLGYGARQYPCLRKRRQNIRTIPCPRGGMDWPGWWRVDIPVDGGDGSWAECVLNVYINECQLCFLALDDAEYTQYCGL